MMADLALAPNTHDLLISNGDLALVAGVDAVRQRLKTTMLVLKGEWRLDPEAGVPWFSQVFKSGDDRILQQQLIRAITGVEGVESLDSLSIDLDRRTRQALVRFGVTADGQRINQELQL